jgi:hypothetical protein
MLARRCGLTWKSRAVPTWSSAGLAALVISSAAGRGRRGHQKSRGPIWPSARGFGFRRSCRLRLARDGHRSPTNVRAVRRDRALEKVLHRHSDPSPIAGRGRAICHAGRGVYAPGPDGVNLAEGPVGRRRGASRRSAASGFTTSGAATWRSHRRPRRGVGGSTAGPGLALRAPPALRSRPSVQGMTRGGGLEEDS